MNRKTKLLLASALLGAAAANAQVTLISNDFESYALGVLWYGPDNGGARHDVTNHVFYDPTLPSGAPNILGMYAGSQAVHEIVVDPLDAGNQVYRINGFANMTGLAGQGIYFMNLDPTGNGTYTSGPVTIGYSFRMLKDPVLSDPDIPNAWQVNWASDPSALDTTALDMNTFLGTPTQIQTFNTSDSAWETVSGSFTADLSTLDTTSFFTTQIIVDATDGAFVSGNQGYFYFDDVSVTVVPEPGMMALFAGYAALGLVLRRRPGKR